MTPHQDMTDAQAAVRARELIDQAFAPTSYRDPTPLPATGDTPPVPQPDARLVPPWASGIAVASLGIGAGVTGIGCGAWLAFQGLASITLAGVAAILSPFVGVAAIAAVVGAAFSKAPPATHIYQAPVVKKAEVHSHTRGLLSRTRIQTD